jgi:hypothetical protein
VNFAPLDFIEMENCVQNARIYPTAYKSPAPIKTTTSVLSVLMDTTGRSVMNVMTSACVSKSRVQQLMTSSVKRVRMDTTDQLVQNAATLQTVLVKSLV